LTRSGYRIRSSAEESYKSVGKHYGEKRITR
jgi:hypothetical protein